MKICVCIALAGALLAISPVRAATIVPIEPPHPTARPAQNAPRPAAKKPTPFYNYNAAGPVSEQFLPTNAPAARHDRWQRDTHARFFHRRRDFSRSAYYPAPRQGIDIDSQGFNGGVGYGSEGGGAGGQGYLYMGQGGSNEPSNGGGVSLPPGYGPTYRGGWQGPVNPTRGGLSRH